MVGTLYLVPTPIGNLQDITLRALDTLNKVDVILAEDTRVSGVLLSHYNISTVLKSFHAHNEHQKISEVIDWLREGKNIAQISDAGTPGISDPGYLLAREAVKQNIPIEVLPGATAFIPALVKSGIPCDRFYFEGFLPQKKGRQMRLDYLVSLPCTWVVYESPHRILRLLNELKDRLHPNTPVSVSRELTKKFEETVNGTIEEVFRYFTAKEKVKGEFVMIIGQYDGSL